MRKFIPNRRPGLIGLMVLCGLLSALAGCSRSVSENVTVSGSSTVLPVISRAAEEYSLQTPGVRVIVNAGGSGVGITQLGEGQTDIGMISRDISQTEQAKFPDADFTTYVIGRDAVVPVVSSEIYETGVTALTIEQIAAIYRGQITNWRDVGGPDTEILVIDKEASRGTRQVFMEAVMGDKNAEAPGAKLVLGSNNEEQTALTQSNAAIGMLSQAWLNRDVKGLAITLSDGSSIEPDLESIRAGKYPIARDLLLVSRSDLSEPSKAFIEYVLSAEGQQLVEDAGYIKVTP
ncbi:PstS family phosphate ABC transporter substrate-binding protein [Parvularcula sp. IMCC14364]|uniref:PstS family phosphate ABC transporter substrate-binding protein n=1 Tax=Parvularcula sp. IMCC14364 TaxID=3067902 RepID=UPI0027404AEE|nr:phosphate ABC transporter substrate-binding protein [Parvularcula sp. IMCC14364]